MTHRRLLTAFGMQVFFIKLSLIFGQIFGLISSFLSNGWLQVFVNGKSSQEYPINAGVPQCSITGPTLFLLYINDLMMLSVILLSVQMILLSTLSVIRHLIYDNNQNWLLNLNLIYKTH